MDVEAEGRPKKFVTAPMAVNTLERLLWGNPGVDIGLVREDFRAVAQWEDSRRRKSPWARSSYDAAACIVMGIDPQTGQTLEDREAALQVYDKHPMIADLKRVYGILSNNPIIQRELAREAAILPTQPQQ